MTVNQWSELELLADKLAIVRGQLQYVTTYEEYCRAKRLLWRLIEPEIACAVRRLLHQRGIEI